MTNDEITWTYGLMRVDGTMDAVYSKGPIPLLRIREIIGGEFEFVHLEDRDRTVVAVRKDKTGLESNHHWTQLFGDVLVGKMPADDFVGMLGIAV